MTPTSPASLVHTRTKGDQQRIACEVLRTELLEIQARAGAAVEQLAEAREAVEERRWMRVQVRTMLAEGWTGAELLEVGITPAWLRSIGFVLPDADADAPARPASARPTPDAPAPPPAGEGRRSVDERLRLCSALRMRSVEREAGIRRVYERMEESRVRRGGTGGAGAA